MTRGTTYRTNSAFACLLLAVALGVALSGCAPTLPSDPPGITGSVASVVAGDGRPASMLVEGSRSQPSGAISDKAQVTIPPSTMFFAADGKAASLDSVAHIAAGTKVRVWFQGAVAESYPVQGSAKAVQILGK
jgi:beta-N-acetylhexosaminidase